MTSGLLQSSGHVYFVGVRGENGIKFSEVQKIADIWNATSTAATRRFDIDKLRFQHKNLRS